MTTIPKPTGPRTPVIATLADVNDAVATILQLALDTTAVSRQQVAVIAQLSSVDHLVAAFFYSAVWAASVAGNGVAIVAGLTRRLVYYVVAAGFV